MTTNPLEIISTKTGHGFKSFTPLTAGKVLDNEIKLELTTAAIGPGLWWWWTTTTTKGNHFEKIRDYSIRAKTMLTNVAL